jgi:hypothetical protein
MNQSFTSCFSVVALALLTAPLAAWADANPDFDDDAKPILRMQPGLLQYVESKFEVKDQGTAKYPGDDDRPPAPPFIFRARPLHSSGPYNLRLLIQPGHPGHILGVVDITKVHLSKPTQNETEPAVANQPPPQPQAVQPSAPANEAPAPSPVVQAPVPSTAAPATQPNEPTADTPSGPIMDSGSQTQSSQQPTLQPPPDPAPSH